MCATLVLALSNFNSIFVLETDDYTNGLGVVLSQEGRQLVFFTKALSPRHLGLSIYKNEHMAILMRVERWRHYLEHD